MFNFDFNPFEVGNFSTLGCFENDQELKVNQLVNDFKYCSVSVSELTNEMRSRGIVYNMLPQYLIDRIDEINVY